MLTLKKFAVSWLTIRSYKNTRRLGRVNLRKDFWLLGLFLACLITIPQTIARRISAPVPFWHHHWKVLPSNVSLRFFPLPITRSLFLANCKSLLKAANLGIQLLIQFFALLIRSLKDVDFFVQSTHFLNFLLSCQKKQTNKRKFRTCILSNTRWNLTQKTTNLLPN